VLDEFFWVVFVGSFFFFFCPFQGRCDDGGSLVSIFLLGGGVLGDSLGALRDGVLGELTWEDEAHSGLDLPGRDGGPLVVSSQLGGLVGDPLKDVVDKGVHDGHGLVGDSGVWVDLLEDLEDVGGVRLLPLVVLLATLGSSLLLTTSCGLGGLGGLGGRLASGLLLSSGLLLGLGGHD